MEKIINERIIEEMKKHTTQTHDETFLIERDGIITFCDLECLNYMINELKLKLKVIASVYYVKNVNIVESFIY